MASESIPEKKLRTSFNGQKKNIVRSHNEQKDTVYNLFTDTTSDSISVATRAASVASTISDKVQAIGITTSGIVDKHSSTSDVDKDDVVRTLSKIRPNQGNWRAQDDTGKTNTNNAKTN